jgi:hypothetical protein
MNKQLKHNIFVEPTTSEGSGFLSGRGYIFYE